MAGKVFFSVTMSLDGFVAGPGAGPGQPLGEGGDRLHEWYYRSRSWRAAHGLEGGEEGPDSDLADSSMATAGAVVMGRGMFCDDVGPWGDEPAQGRWGDEPPFGVPVFVVTHHAREPVEMEGGTTFHFVTDGIHAALERARDAAGARDVKIGGGVSTVRQYLRAGLIDELHFALSPVLLGRGEAMFEGLDLPALGYRVMKSTATDLATHVVLGR